MTENVIVSRNVTFDEKDVQDWSTEDLDIAEVTLNYQQEEDNYNIQPSSIAQGPQIKLTEHPQCQRQMLARLQDYVITLDDIPSNEDIVNFALFIDYDPVVYEKAANDDRWMKVMEKEIHAIKEMRLRNLLLFQLIKKSLE